MTEITLRYDHDTESKIKSLMKYWGYKDEAELFVQTLTHFLLMTAVDSTDGELIARKGTHETKILLR
jgi:hypothetical protein